ncbi:hypothetical protein ONE63_004553 [Megalurothrips usitatus]|uniref:Uncharacterized protein n=1 Tax=Megalurothrips usitatus TaxID=439358 RepID=A0AAV7X032_9NEOP|nr:hypothetical protein ONE63_004553 [Megalurothrips usitatus]
MVPGTAVCLLSVVAAALAAVTPPICDFEPSCRPGETYRVPIPCEGKCSNYIQCTDGAAVEKKCGKFFWHQNQFDAQQLDCVRDADCDWWKTTTTTSTSTTPATTTVTAAPSTPTTTETTPAPSSTEATSTTSTEVPSSSTTVRRSSAPHQNVHCDKCLSGTSAAGRQK